MSDADEMTLEPEHLDVRSHDIVGDSVAELLRLFPEIRTGAGRLDFDRLKLALGEAVDVGRERYGLNWPGKAECFKTIQMPSLGTLLPCREESVNFETTDNLIIEGDNLEVLKLLQKSYLGKVKMIYIDPPYNTGNDFIYPDKYSESLQTYLEYTGQVDSEGKKFSTNVETDGRFHSNWLNMMYPRLYLSRNLLREDGVIFISIDEVELNNLHKLCDEIFGEENFVECIVWNKRIPKNDKGIGNIHEYILVYVKDSSWQYKFTMPKEGLEEVNNLVTSLKRKEVPILAAEAELRKLYEKKGYDRAITLYNCLDSDYRVWGKINVSWPNANTFGPRYDVLHPVSKKPVAVPDRGWRWKRETFDDLLDYSNIVERDDGSYMCGSIWFDAKESTQPSLVKYLDAVDTLLLRSILSLKSDGGIEVEGLLGEKNLYSYPKPTSLLKTLIRASGLQSGDIVLDFFAGSGTTAHAVIDLNSEDGGNRKFILVQLPEPTGRQDYPTIADVMEERVRRVIERRARKRGEQLALSNSAEVDLGFRVFKLDESSFNRWDADLAEDPDALAQQLELHVNHINESRTAPDLLYEILLKSGFPVTTPVETLSLDDKGVYSVAGGALVICLERELALSTVRAIAGRKPERVVCLDEGFAGNDQLKANAAQIFKTQGITSFKTV